MKRFNVNHAILRLNDATPQTFSSTREPPHGAIMQLTGSRVPLRDLGVFIVMKLTPLGARVKCRGISVLLPAGLTRRSTLQKWVSKRCRFAS